MVDHSRLGRGLASLMGEVAEESPMAEVSRKPRKAPVENLSPNPRNPRSQPRIGRLCTHTRVTRPVSDLDFAIA